MIAVFAIAALRDDCGDIEVIGTSKFAGKNSVRIKCGNGEQIDIPLHILKDPNITELPNCVKAVLDDSLLEECKLLNGKNGDN
jgi:hypothetical protein